MVESCLKCGVQADLPDGHRLIVCAACGAVQSKVLSVRRSMDKTIATAAGVSQLTTLCPACHGVISRTAKTCPHCGHSETTNPTASTIAARMSRFKWTPTTITLATVGGVCTLVLAGFLTMGVFWGQPLPKLTAECQKEIRSRLKSPASAQFSGTRSNGSVAKKSVTMIFGSVDSQNGFGAMLRSTYVCEVSGSKLKSAWIM